MTESLQPRGRAGHLFTYYGREVVAALNARKEYLEGRIADYTDRRDQLLAELQQDAKVEWYETQITGGTRWSPQIVYDHAKSSELDRCQERCRDHRTEIDRIKRLVPPYEHASGETFEFTPEDVVTFYLDFSPPQDD